MNAARATGLPLDNSRPQSRAARREEAARLQAEQQAAEQETAQQPSVVNEPAPTPTAPAPTPRVKIPMKKRADKRPFSTQLSSETTTRLAWLVQQGGVLTDTIEAAVSTYLDTAGIPRPSPDGTMPNS
jgi:hypothetical protein